MLSSAESQADTFNSLQVLYWFAFKDIVNTFLFQMSLKQILSAFSVLELESEFSLFKHPS